MHLDLTDYQTRSALDSLRQSRGALAAHLREEAGTPEAIARSQERIRVLDGVIVRGSVINLTDEEVPFVLASLRYTRHSIDATVRRMGGPSPAPKKRRRKRKDGTDATPRPKPGDGVKAYLAEHGPKTVHEIAGATAISTDAVRNAVKDVAIIDRRGAHGVHYWRLP